MFELEPTATDKLFRSGKADLVRGLDRIAGLARQLVVDLNQPRHDRAFGLLPTRAKSALDQRLIQTEHGRSICKCSRQRSEKSQKP